MAFDSRIFFDFCHKGHVGLRRSLTDCLISLASVNPSSRIVTGDGFFETFGLSCQNQTIGAFPIVIARPFIWIVVILCQNSRKLANIVLDIVKIMREPNIEQVVEILIVGLDTIPSRDSCRMDMVSLVEIEFYILSRFFQDIIHKLELFGFDIIII